MGIISAWGNTELWDAEYLNPAIPSSHRVTPAKALVDNWNEYAHLTGPGRTVLDAGAGTGRNALFFERLGCRVHAVDSSSVACGIIEQHETETLTIDNETLSAATSFGDTYDIILDSYVSCHILDNNKRLLYLENLLTHLKPGGKLITLSMGTNDTYYQQYAKGLIVIDPLNNIPKLLQRHSTQTVSLTQIGPTKTASKRFMDIVGNKNESREVLSGIISR